MLSWQPQSEIWKPVWLQVHAFVMLLLVLRFNKPLLCQKRVLFRYLHSKSKEMQLRNLGSVKWFINMDKCCQQAWVCISRAKLNMPYFLLYNIFMCLYGRIDQEKEKTLNIKGKLCVLKEKVHVSIHIILYWSDFWGKNAITLRKGQAVEPGV